MKSKLQEVDCAGKWTSWKQNKPSRHTDRAVFHIKKCVTEQRRTLRLPLRCLHRAQPLWQHQRSHTALCDKCLNRQNVSTSQGLSLIPTPVQFLSACPRLRWASCTGQQTWSMSITWWPPLSTCRWFTTRPWSATRTRAMHQVRKEADFRMWLQTNKSLESLFFFMKEEGNRKLITSLDTTAIILRNFHNYIPRSRISVSKGQL